jgi:hypothetical protein
LKYGKKANTRLEDKSVFLIAYLPYLIIKKKIYLCPPKKKSF